MKDVEFKCRRFFPQKNITCQDNVITIEHETIKSTALFASCYNTHVSNKFFLPTYYAFTDWTGKEY